MRRSSTVFALSLFAALLSPSSPGATTHVFFLPWDYNVPREVTCGNGCSRHTGGDYYAWDFDGNNWFVRAARTGTIVALRDTEGVGADEPEYRDNANYVRILHSDGTETLYTHLARFSTREFGLVDGQVEGDVVVRHSIIGRTDSSGRTTGPHLHYQRQTNCAADDADGFCNSLASTFSDAGVPTTGQTVASGNLYPFESTPTYPGEGWSSPFVSRGTPSTGNLTSGMDAASWEEGRVDAFARGATFKLEHALRTASQDWVWDGTVLGAPTGLTLVGDPTAVSWNDGHCGVANQQDCHIDVFARASDNNLWQKPYRDGWSGWINLGAPEGGIQSDPDVAARAYNRLDVFALGVDGFLWQKSWYGQSPWSGWNYRGRPGTGALLSGPSAISWGPGRIDVFARGQGNDLYQIVWTGSDPWSLWGNLCAPPTHPGCDIFSAPDASSWAVDRIDVFAQGSGSDLYHRVWAPGWSAWENLCGTPYDDCTLNEDPGAVSWGWGRIDVVSRIGSNFNHKRYGR